MSVLVVGVVGENLGLIGLVGEPLVHGDVALCHLDFLLEFLLYCAGAVVISAWGYGVRVVIAEMQDAAGVELVVHGFGYA